MNILLCFSGQIGSGKSSISVAVANTLGWRRGGFGDYLRDEIARGGGDPNSREALQDLGQRRVEENAPAFCRDVLTAGGFQPGRDFVIDGIRHVSIFENLQTQIAPMQARMLFLSAQEATRLVRVESRPDRTDFARASDHRVEAQLRTVLPEYADAIVDANEPMETVIANCLNWVRLWRQDT